MHSELDKRFSPKHCSTLKILGRHRDGMGLLELLVALAILGLIAAALVSALTLTLRYQARGQSVQVVEEPILLRSHLRRWIAAAERGNTDARFNLSFTGKETGFRFLTFAVPEYFAEATALIVEVTYKSGKAELTLIYLNKYEQVLSIEKRILIETPSKPIFTYYSKRTGWQNTWALPTQLPDLIKIEIEKSRLYWPEFVVAPILK